MKTYYYKKLLSATTEEQAFDLPRLRKFSLLINGDNNCYIEIDNNITADSALYQIGVPYSFSSGYLKLYYKAESGTSTIQIIGEKHFKE